MEWDCGSHIDDFAVPTDGEIFDRFPSPDSWPMWGKTVGNFNFPKNLTALGVEEILDTGTTFFSEAEQLATPCVGQGSEHAFHGQNAYPQHPDLQINDLDMIEEADDIFFHSLFRDATEVGGVERSSKFTRSSSNDDVISVNLSGERYHHIQDCANDVDNIRPLAKFEEPEFDIGVSEKHSKRYDVCKNLSMEESVLLELQRSSLQLTDKTRRCVRDSLYRLAENSRHQTKCIPNGKAAKNCKTTSRSTSSRLQQTETQVSHTNAIDRSIATLLFNFPSPPASTLTEHTLNGEMHQVSSNLYPPTASISCLHSSVPEHDAEVPMFRLTDQLLTPPRACQHLAC